MREIVATGGRYGVLTTEIVVGRHSLVADEPVTLGGQGGGPDPFEYLLAGLGACTVMTLRLYADRKGWPLERTVVTLRHALRATGDQRDGFSREIRLVGDLSEAEQARLLEIAERCPVGRTLAAGVDIHSTLVAETPIGEASS